MATAIDLVAGEVEVEVEGRQFGWVLVAADAVAEEVTIVAVEAAAITTAVAKVRNRRIIITSIRRILREGLAGIIPTTPIMAVGEVEAVQLHPLR
jgi:hypothetical protein